MALLQTLRSPCYSSVTVPLQFQAPLRRAMTRSQHTLRFLRSTSVDFLLLQTCFFPAFFLLQTCFLPAFFLLHSCFLPASILLSSCFKPAFFLLSSCFKPAFFLLQSCFFPAFFLLFSSFLPASILLSSYDFKSSLLFQCCFFLNDVYKRLFIIPLFTLKQSPRNPEQPPVSSIFSKYTRLPSTLVFPSSAIS